MPTINKPKQGGKPKREYQKGRYIEPRYNTQHWRNLRLSVLQASPLCRVCEDAGLITLAQMVDHIKPVRLGGDFYDVENLQPLCNSCHASKSAKERNADPYGV
jgi:5-methylcytosine-specific restriction endonuclease McrA